MSGAADTPADFPSRRLGGIPGRYIPGEGQGEMIEAEHVGRYRWAAQLAEGRRVLDAGCGAGYGCVLMLEAGAGAAVGVDSDPEAIALAEANSGGRGDFRLGDLASLEFDDASFDLVVCFEVIEHVEDQARVLDELARVLAPEGVLVVSSPNPAGYPAGNPHHIRELGPGQLRDALGARFRSIHMYPQRAWRATSILSEEDETRPDSALLVQVAPNGGPAPYTIAVAANESLPELAPVTALTEGIDQKGLADSWRSRGEEIEALRRQLAEAEEAAVSRRTRLTKAEQEIAELPGHATVRTDLDIVLTSWSWRLTAPLRVVSGGLRRITNAVRLGAKRILASMIVRLARLTGREP